MYSFDVNFDLCLFFFPRRNAQFLCIVGIFGDFPLGLINVVPSEIQIKDPLLILVQCILVRFRVYK
jgi:hypothetical protein